MRKILLTTTALVALGGVSAASADIAISGSYHFNYTTGTGGTFATDDDTMSTGVDFGISASTVLDNGMSASAGLDLDETGGLDDSGATLSGDFGTLKFGGYAEDDFGAMATDVTADEGDGFTHVATNALDYGNIMPGDEHIDASDVSLTLPSVSGVTVMLGASSADNSMAGVSYAATAGSMSITVGYSQSSGTTANSDDTQVSAKVAAGSASVIAISGETGVFNYSSIGATYAVSDALTLQVYSGTTDHDTETAYEVEDTGIGLSYTVTPGMKLSFTSNDYSGKGGTDNGVTTDVSGTRNNIALDISF
jgi:hypothetical protein